MKTKTHRPILRALLAAFVIIATGAAFTHANNSAQPTKPNPFDSIINRVMYVDDEIGFEDFYPMFEVNFKNLKNYNPVQTEGCTILEVYNVTKGHPITFLPSWQAYGFDEDPYMPDWQSWYPMTNVFVWIWENGNVTCSNGDMLKITFKIPDDSEYESPEFVLYAPYLYNPDDQGGIEVLWD